MKLGEFRKFTAKMGDDVEIVLTGYHGRADLLDEYDDYEGTPDGTYLTLWAAEIKEGKLWLG